MRRLMAEMQIDDIISSGFETKGLELLNNRPSVGSLSETNEFSTDEMYRFLMNSRNVLTSPITSSEEFLGEFLKQQFKNIRLEGSIHDLLVEYYMIIYVDLIFRKLFTEDSPGSVIVLDKANQYGRCRISAEKFGSTISQRHIKSSFILVKFINLDGKASISTLVKFST